MPNHKWEEVKQLAGNDWLIIRHGEGRKLGQWKEANSTLTISKECYDNLTKIDLSYTSPADTLPDGVTGSIFIAIVDGVEYLVNTEGYFYSRYIAKVDVK